MKNIKGYTQVLNELDEQEDLNSKLLIATKGKNLYRVKRLLDRGAEVDARDEDGQTSLHWAAWYGEYHIDIARLLLDKGADPNAAADDGRTPLHLAVVNGNTSNAKLLIQRGADPFKAFDGPEEVIEFFGGDIDWMPEDIKAKLRRMQRGKQAFGM